MKKLVLTFLTLFLFQTPALGTTKVGISGDKFTINDEETFLLGVSYFDAFNWHASDLDQLNARGYNLIRVWLDWEDRGLFDPDGNLTWEQPLVDLVEASDARGLVVDVTILDGSLSFGPGNREKAVREAVSALKGKPNVIFDIMNAHDSGEHALSHTQVKTLIEAVVEEDPDAIITVSSSPGHIIKGKTLQKTRVDEELSAGITLFTPHLPRTSDWYSRTEERVTRIKNHLKDTARMVPVYLQEEARRGLAKLNPTQDEFLQAAKAALSAGAAAWIFHTAAGFDLAGGSLFSRLDAVEKSTIDALPKAIFGSDTGPAATATATTASDTSTKNTLSEDLVSAPQQQPNTTEQSPSVFAATSSARATGETYYADTNHPSASDSNPGTEVLPWKTIQKAANMLVAGDTVYIKQGTYTGSTVTAKNSGTASGWITYSAYPGHEHKAILNGFGFTISGKSYIKLSGLRIQNVGPISNGIDILGPGSNITISGNYTYNTVGSGIAGWGSNYWATFIDSALTDLIIENNKIEKANEGGYNENITLAYGIDRFEVRGNMLSNPANNESFGGEGIDVKQGVQNGKIHHNIITGATRDRIAIYVDAFDRYVKNVEVFNNIVYDTNTEGVVVAFEQPGGVVDNVKIYNNLFYGNGQGGVAIHDFGYTNGTINNISVMNNTIYGNGHKVGHGAYGIWVNTQIATNVVLRNNISYKNEGTFYLNNPGIVSSNNFTTDPQFVNEAAKDFHLKSTSPAINAGSSASAPATDYDEKARPQGGAFDIGAYEYCSGTCATPPSGSVNAVKVATGPVINGQLSERSWNLSQSVTKNTIGTGNNTTTFDVLWDNTYLYVGVKVLDAMLNNDSTNVWDDDSVEVYVDSNHSHNAGYDSTDFQFNKPYNDSGLFGLGPSVSSGVLHGWAATTGGYTVELAIPWTKLGVTPTNNMTIGFSVGVNDDDNGAARDSQMMWNGTSANSYNTSAFGHAVLNVSS